MSRNIVELLASCTTQLLVFNARSYDIFRLARILIQVHFSWVVQNEKKWELYNYLARFLLYYLL